jgi:hypothetical protein
VISDHKAAIHESAVTLTNVKGHTVGRLCCGGVWGGKGWVRSLTGSGNSLILLLRTFKYRSKVHSANRAGKDEILL